jgi:hypothetical protein
VADPLTLKAGFGSFNVFVRSFLMRQDYERMLCIVGPNPPFDIDPYFEELIEAFNVVPKEQQGEQKKKMLEFFKVGKVEHEKMFDTNWVKGDGSFLAAFSEYETASIVCQRLMDLPLCFPQEKQYFKSSVHNRTIDLREFTAFVKRNIGECHRINTHVQHNKILFTKIAAEGFDLWNKTNPLTKIYRQAALRRYGIIFSSNIAAERSNKVQNNAATNRRQEENVSMRVAAVGNLSEMTR